STDELADDYEDYDELVDEWEDEQEEAEGEPAPRLTAEELAELKREKEELAGFLALAKSIARDAKGEALLMALRRGFEAAAEAQAAQGSPVLQQKAVVFTESRRTQQYLFGLLQETQF